jgi:hypothetical protein
MGIKFSPKIGIDALRTRVNAAINGEDDKPDEEETASPKHMTKAERDAQMRKEIYAKELKLIRVRIACMNPEKKDWPGEIITVANRYIGNVKKFIPFNSESDRGFHVPNVIFKTLKSRKFLHKSSRRDRQTGQIVVTTKWMPEFSIEVLPQLTEQELQDLAREQAMKGGVE